MPSSTGFRRKHEQTNRVIGEPEPVPLRSDTDASTRIDSPDGTSVLPDAGRPRAEPGKSAPHGSNEFGPVRDLEVAV